jgi:hypothetical protein
MNYLFELLFKSKEKRIKERKKELESWRKTLISSLNTISNDNSLRTETEEILRNSLVRTDEELNELSLGRIRNFIWENF